MNKFLERVVLRRQEEQMAQEAALTRTHGKPPVAHRPCQECGRKMRPDQAHTRCSYCRRKRCLRCRHTMRLGAKDLLCPKCQREDVEKVLRAKQKRKKA